METLNTYGETLNTCGGLRLRRQGAGPERGAGLHGSDPDRGHPLARVLGPVLYKAPSLPFLFGPLTWFQHGHGGEEPPCWPQHFG